MFLCACEIWIDASQKQITIASKWRIMYPKNNKTSHGLKIRTK